MFAVTDCEREFYSFVIAEQHGEYLAIAERERHVQRLCVRQRLGEPLTEPQLWRELGGIIIRRGLCLTDNVNYGEPECLAVRVRQRRSDI